MQVLTGMDVVVAVYDCVTVSGASSGCMCWEELRIVMLICSELRK